MLVWFFYSLFKVIISNFKLLRSYEKKINFKSKELETEKCITFRGGTIHLCTYVSLYMCIHLADIQIDKQIYNNDTRYCTFPDFQNISDCKLLIDDASRNSFFTKRYSFLYSSKLNWAIFCSLEFIESEIGFLFSLQMYCDTYQIPLWISYVSIRLVTGLSHPQPNLRNSTFFNN